MCPKFIFTCFFILIKRQLILFSPETNEIEKHKALPEWVQGPLPDCSRNILTEIQRLVSTVVCCVVCSVVCSCQFAVFIEVFTVQCVLLSVDIDQFMLVWP